MRITLLAAMLVTLAVPAAAPAAVRHASPGAPGSACTVAAKCSLGTAVTGAADDDEIVVHPGTYTVAGSGIGSTTKTLNVHGAAGEAVPLIASAVDSGACGLTVGPGSQIERLNVRIDVDYTRGLCPEGDTGIVYVRIESAKQGIRGIHAGNTAQNQYVQTTFIRLTGSGSIGIHSFRFAGASFSGVTVLATGPSGEGIRLEAGDENSSAEVVNSIVRGTAEAFRLVCTTHTATLGIAYTAYTQASTPCTFTTYTGNVPISGVRIDEHGTQTRGSNTTDAGVDFPGVSPFDIDGDPHTMGAAVDIGADERRPLPLALTGAASEVTETTALLAGSVDGRGAAVTRSFEYGPTEEYGTTATDATLTGLVPGTTYHFRTVATNQFGLKAYGAPATFTTAGIAPGGGDGPPPGDGLPLPVPPTVLPTPAVSAAGCTGLRVRRRRARRAVVTGRCAKASKLRLVVRRKGRRRRVITVDVPAGDFTRRVRVPARGKLKVRLPA